MAVATILVSNIDGINTDPDINDKKYNFITTYLKIIYFLVFLSCFIIFSFKYRKQVG